jgi:hypothetical protein
MKRTRPPDLARYTDARLVDTLAGPDEALRWAALEQLVERGEKQGWEVYALLTQDRGLADLFLSPKDPFEAVGVAVSPDTYERVRAAWPGARELADAEGRRELVIDFRNQRLDVIKLPPFPEAVGAAPPGREGLAEVEIRVKDVGAFVERLAEVPPDLKGRMHLLPSTGDPAAVESRSAAAEGRFLLVHTRSARGARTVLVQLLPEPPSS